MELELITYDRLLPEFGIKDSRSTISRKMKQKPPKFPLSVKISDSRIGWYRHEIKEHVENLKRGNAVNFREKKVASKATR